MAESELDIRYIAKLARLHVDDSEVEKFQKDMGSIVKMVENLPDFEKADENLNAAEAMKLREDEIKPSMPRRTILQNAPKTEAGCIVVPKIVE